MCVTALSCFILLLYSSLSLIVSLVPASQPKHPLVYDSFAFTTRVFFPFFINMMHVILFARITFVRELYVLFPCSLWSWAGFPVSRRTTSQSQLPSRDKRYASRSCPHPVKRRRCSAGTLTKRTCWSARWVSFDISLLS